MAESLADLRKARGLTQEALGSAMAARLEGRKVEHGWGQKRISRFEAGTAEPTREELTVLSTLLGLDPQIVLTSIKSGAPSEAARVLKEVVDADSTRRSLMAICCMSRARTWSLDDSFRMMETVMKRGLTLCAFVPYPNTMHLPDFVDHAEMLAGYYRRIRKSVTDANSLFKNRLAEKGVDPNQIALYLPRQELMKGSGVLIPPIFRQFSLTIDESDSGITKTLLEWTPSTDKDLATPLLGTGVHSLDEQIEAWEAFFGDVITQWLETSELVASDGYWERIR